MVEIGSLTLRAPDLLGYIRFGYDNVTLVPLARATRGGGIGDYPGVFFRDCHRELCPAGGGVVSVFTKT